MSCLGACATTVGLHKAVFIAQFIPGRHFVDPAMEAVGSKMDIPLQVSGAFFSSARNDK